MSRNLFRAPLLGQPCLSKDPGRRIDPRRIGATQPANPCQRVCKIGLIAAVSPASCELAADRGRMSTQLHGDCRLSQPCLLERLYLISFISCEVCVIHFGQFDLAVKGFGMLTHTSPTPTSGPNCTSKLNSPGEDREARITSGRSGEDADSSSVMGCSAISHASRNDRAGSSFTPTSNKRQTAGATISDQRKPKRSRKSRRPPTLVPFS